MSHLRYATLIFAFLAFVAGPAAAMAGDLGPTSRATAIISITIPAHVEARQATHAGTNDTNPNGQMLCITESRQLGSYRIALVAATDGKSGPGIVPLELSNDVTFECGPPGSAALASLTRDEVSGMSSRPLTLLIIPD